MGSPSRSTRQIRSASSRAICGSSRAAPSTSISFPVSSARRKREYGLPSLVIEHMFACMSTTNASQAVGAVTPPAADPGRLRRRRQIRIVVGGALGLLALLELVAQILRFLGAAPVALSLGARAGIRDLFAFSVLLAALAAPQILNRRIVAAHRKDDSAPTTPHRSPHRCGSLGR